MQLKKVLFAVSMCAIGLISGCATYKTTLTNAKGETVTCEASGHAGIVTGHYLREGYEECVNNAKANGYQEGSGQKSQQQSHGQH